MHLIFLSGFLVYCLLNHWMAALWREFYINFISLVLQKVAAGLINEVAKIEINKMIWKIHLDFPDLATIMRWSY